MAPRKGRDGYQAAARVEKGVWQPAMRESRYLRSEPDVASCGHCHHCTALSRPKGARDNRNGQSACDAQKRNANATDQHGQSHEAHGQMMLVDEQATQ